MSNNYNCEKYKLLILDDNFGFDFSKIDFQLKYISH